jgi:hypothetical protein
VLPAIETSGNGAGAPARIRVVLEEVRHQAMNQRAGPYRVRLGSQQVRALEHRGERSPGQRNTEYTG